MSMELVKREFVFTCDGCEVETLETGTADFQEAQQARKDAGWTIKNTPLGWLHYCPDCGR